MPLTDPSELFQTRIDALKKMRGELDDEGKVLVDAAVSETVEAEYAFVKLSDFAVGALQSLKSGRQNLSAKLQESLEQLEEMRLNAETVLANPRATQQQKEDVVALWRAAVDGTRTVAQVQGATQELEAETLGNAITLLVNVLSERILRPNHHQFDVKAVQDLIDFSLVIVGTRWPNLAYLAATTGLILKLFVFNRIPPADARKVYLENYIASEKAWIKAVNAIIEAFESAQVQA